MVQRRKHEKKIVSATVIATVSKQEQKKTFLNLYLTILFFFKKAELTCQISDISEDCIAFCAKVPNFYFNFFNKNLYVSAVWTIKRFVSTSRPNFVIIQIFRLKKTCSTSFFWTKIYWTCLDFGYC